MVFKLGRSFRDISSRSKAYLNLAYIAHKARRMGKTCVEGRVYRSKGESAYTNHHVTGIIKADIIIPGGPTRNIYSSNTRYRTSASTSGLEALSEEYREAAERLITAKRYLQTKEINLIYEFQALALISRLGLQVTL